MSEVKIKLLAWKVLHSDKAVTSTEKQLASCILTYFDPDFFFKSIQGQIRSVNAKEPNYVEPKRSKKPGPKSPYEPREKEEA